MRHKAGAKGRKNVRVGKGGHHVAPLLMALHDLDLVHVLHRLRGGGEGGGGERKDGNLHGSYLLL